jgi:exopolysaccharide biosynthesis polyprenyl glycosylphosphotransferase
LSISTPTGKGARRRIPLLRRETLGNGEVVASVDDLAVIHTPAVELPVALPIIAPEPSLSRRTAVVRALVLGRMVGDAACIVLAIRLAELLLGRPGARAGAADFLIGAVVWVAVLAAFGLHVIRALPPAGQMRRIAGAAAIGVILVSAALSGTDTALGSRGILLLWAIAMILTVSFRGLASIFESRVVGTGGHPLRTLIIGADEEAARLAETVRGMRSGINPLGYVVSTRGAGVRDGLPVLGHIDSLDQLVAEHAIDCLFLAPTALHREDLEKVMQTARRAGLDIKLSASLPSVLASRVSVEQFGGEAVIALHNVRLRRMQSWMKRGFDLVGATILFIASAPLWSAVAVAIKLTSKGPVLFRQRRVTKGGREFNMLKFRTMTLDGDALLRARGLDPTAPFFKVEDDPRLTWIGRFMRSTSLDELPQLLNIIRGEMSLVGPRPLPIEQVSANLGLLAPRHEVAAGLTGWWQINGRNTVGAEEAVRLDLFYIENWSLGLDLYLLAKTVWAVLTRRGAY